MQNKPMEKNSLALRRKAWQQKNAVAMGRKVIVVDSEGNKKLVSPGYLARQAAKKRRAAAAKAKRRRVYEPRGFSKPAPPSYGPKIVRQAMRHAREIYSKRDSSYFVHDIFTECGLVYPHTPARYFPPHSYFIPVKSPVEGDVVLYADHMGIYMTGHKLISAEPGPEAVHISTVSAYLNFMGYYRWFQDYKRG